MDNAQDVHVVVTDTPEGLVHLLTLVPPEVAGTHGLAAAAIVGSLTRPLTPGERITPHVFARNSVFVDYLHTFLARHAADDPSFRLEATRLGEGWVYIIDQRTPSPGDQVPPEDIIGASQVVGGAIVPGSYWRNESHRILSERGFFRLGKLLHAALIQDLVRECRNSAVAT